jgi:hypothetical protein
MWATPRCCKVNNNGAQRRVLREDVGAFGWLITDARPKLVKAIIAIEPAEPPPQSEAIHGNGHMVIAKVIDDWVVRNVK